MDKKQKTYLGLGIGALIVFLLVVSGGFTAILGGSGVTSSSTCEAQLKTYAYQIWDDRVKICQDDPLVCDGLKVCTPCSTEFGDATHYNAWCFLTGSPGAACLQNEGLCLTPDCTYGDPTQCSVLSDGCTESASLFGSQGTNYKIEKLSCYNDILNNVAYKLTCLNGYELDGYSGQTSIITADANLLLSTYVCVDNTIPPNPETVCGDGVCDSDETKTNCAKDCDLCYYKTEGEGNFTSFTSSKTSYSVGEKIDLSANFRTSKRACYLIEAQKEATTQAFSTVFTSSASACNNNPSYPGVYEEIQADSLATANLNFIDGFDKPGTYKIGVRAYRGCSQTLEELGIAQKIYDTEYLTVTVVGETPPVEPCDDGAVRVDGVCQPPTPGECGVNEELVNGDCACKDGYELLNGVCTFVSVQPCASPERLVGGVCKECEWKDDIWFEEKNKLSDDGCPTYSFSLSDWIQEHVWESVIGGFILLMLIIIGGDYFGWWKKLNRRK